MIAAIQNIAVGNALRVWTTPPVATSRVRILRKETDDIVGWDDPDAFVVADGPEKVATDYTGLINGTTVYYRAFYRSGDDWLASTSRSATPESAFNALFIDPLSIVRDRLELGLKGYVERGELLNERGFIPVLIASPQLEEVSFPMVTCHVQNDAADVRALGELVALDTFDGEHWRSYEGTIARTDLLIVGWSLNADERIVLRNALKALLAANLPIFDAAGLLQVQFSFSDLDDFETYGTPMFQALGQFSCHATMAVESIDAPIRDTSVCIRTSDNP